LIVEQILSQYGLAVTLYVWKRHHVDLSSLDKTFSTGYFEKSFGFDSPVGCHVCLQKAEIPGKEV